MLRDMVLHLMHANGEQHSEPESKQDQKPTDVLQPAH
jgi:hypothetical protein